MATVVAIDWAHKKTRRRFPGRRVGILSRSHSTRLAWWAALRAMSPARLAKSETTSQFLGWSVLVAGLSEGLKARLLVRCWLSSRHRLASCVGWLSKTDDL